MRSTFDGGQGTRRPFFPNETATRYCAVGQLPLYYNHMNTGRPPDANNKYTSKYLDVDWKPLFPFGYGLSYTTFEITNLRLSKNRIRSNETLTVTVDVKNTGQRAGDEVVQLYLRDLVASVSRPVKELKGFQRIALRPGETKQVEFVIGAEQLGFWNRAMRFVVEPGAFQVMVGSSSEATIETKFEVVR